MIDKNIVKKRLKLLFKDVTENIKFDNADFKDDGYSIIISLVKESIIEVFAYFTFDDSWRVNIDSEITDGTGFNEFIDFITRTESFCDDLLPAWYYLDSNFFVYCGTIDQDNRLLACDKNDMQESINCRLGQYPKFYIVNNNTDQIVEIRC